MNASNLTDASMFGLAVTIIYIVPAIIAYSIIRVAPRFGVSTFGAFVTLVGSVAALNAFGLTRDNLVAYIMILIVVDGVVHFQRRRQARMA